MPVWDLLLGSGAQSTILSEYTARSREIVGCGRLTFLVGHSAGHRTRNREGGQIADCGRKWYFVVGTENDINRNNLILR